MNDLLIDPNDPNSFPDSSKVDFEIRVEVDLKTSGGYGVKMYITTGHIPLNTDSTDTYTFTSYKDGTVTGTPVGTVTMSNIRVTATNQGETVNGSFDYRSSAYICSGTFDKTSLTGGTVRDLNSAQIGTITCTSGSCTYMETSSGNTWSVSS